MSGNKPYLILFDNRENHLIKAAEESANTELGVSMVFGVVLLPVMLLGDPLDQQGAATDGAILGLAISKGLSACAIKYENPKKIITALASLGVR